MTRRPDYTFATGEQVNYCRHELPGLGGGPVLCSELEGHHPDSPHRFGYHYWQGDVEGREPIEPTGCFECDELVEYPAGAGLAVLLPKLQMMVWCHACAPADVSTTFFAQARDLIKAKLKEKEDGREQKDG